MPATRNEWDVFLRGQEARYQPRIYALLAANMAAVATAMSEEDNPESVLVRLNSLLQVSAMSNLLLSLYVNVGLQWAIRSRRAANEQAKFNDRLNREALKESLRRQMQVSAIKNAHDIVKTQKKQIARIIENGVDSGKPKEDIAKELKTGKVSINHSVLITRTETPAAANKGALAAADQSEYLYLKKWFSQHDAIVRFPGNPTYIRLGWPNPKFDHAAVHGQELPLNQPFLDTLGYIQYPGDTDANIANRARCRCWLEMVMQLDAQGRPMKKNGITVLMPRGRLGQQVTQGDVTIIQPNPDITIIQPGSIPNRPTITI
jgi:hypothetical protein